MSAATQLSLVAMSTSAARGAALVQPDGEGTEDLYAVWKSVFERARAVEVSRDEAYSRAPGWRDSPVNGHACDASTEIATSRHDVARSSAVTVIRRPTIERVGAAPFTTDDAGTNATKDVAPEPSATTASMTPRRGATSIVAVARRSSPVVSHSEMSTASMSAVAEPHPAAAELVNVLVRGAAVTIVVRDVELSADEALHCAFETARELTGQRAALHQLTLNGRIVYQHSDADASGSQHGFEPRESVLVFAC